MRRLQQKSGAEKRRTERRRTPRKKGGGAPKRKRVTVAQFFKEVRAEMRKVSWPTRAEVVSYTVVVLITVTITGTFVVLADVGFTRLVEVLLLR
jgi:preprotein translocase subunit SecE